MEDMFYTTFESIYPIHYIDLADLSSWDVSNVCNMKDMFKGCNLLKDVSGLSNWDVFKVVTMDGMFSNCSNLIDISGFGSWNVSNVSSMEDIFRECYSLDNISDLEMWDVSNVKTMWCMFAHCKSLSNISALSNWNVSNVKTMEGMFVRCDSLVDASSLSNWTIRNTYGIQNMFFDCKNLEEYPDWYLKEDVDYVKKSHYMWEVFKTLENDVLIQKEIIERSRVSGDHVRISLSELKWKELITIINPEAHRGKLYKITDKGSKVIKQINKSN